MEIFDEALFSVNKQKEKILTFQKAKPFINKALIEMKKTTNFVKYSQLTPEQRKYIEDVFPPTLGVEIRKKVFVAGVEIFYYEDKDTKKLSHVMAFVPKKTPAKKINFKKYMKVLEQSNILNYKGEKEMNIFDNELFIENAVLEEDNLNSLDEENNVSIMDEEFDPSEYEVIIEGAKYYDMRGFFKKYPEIKAAQSAVNQANVILRANGEPNKQTVIKIGTVVCRICQVLADIDYIPACFVGVFTFWIAPLVNRLYRYLIDLADFALAKSSVTKTIQALNQLKNKAEKESEKEKIQKEIDRLEKVLQTLDESYLLPADDQSLEVMQEGLFKKKAPFASNIGEAKPAIAKAIAAMKAESAPFTPYNQLTSDEKAIIKEIFIDSTKGVGGSVGTLKISGVDILYTQEKLSRNDGEKISNVIGFKHGKAPYIVINYRKYMEVKKEEAEVEDLTFEPLDEDLYDLGLGESLEENFEEYDEYDLGL